MILFILGIFIVTPSAEPSGKIKISKSMSFAPPNIQTLYYSQKYSDSLGVPYQQIRRSLEKETGFMGLFHFSYNPYQISSAGALGPLQVMKNTGRFIMRDNDIHKDDLLYNIPLNIKAGTKYAKYLLNKYSPEVAWTKYNGSSDSVNNYGRSVANGM